MLLFCFVIILLVSLAMATTKWYNQVDAIGTESEIKREKRESINNCEEIENNGNKESLGCIFSKQLLQSIDVFIFLFHLFPHRFIHFSHYRLSFRNNPIWQWRKRIFRIVCLYSVLQCSILQQYNVIIYTLLNVIKIVHFSVRFIRRICN